MVMAGALTVKVGLGVDDEVDIGSLQSCGGAQSHFFADVHHLSRRRRRKPVCNVFATGGL